MDAPLGTTAHDLRTSGTTHPGVAPWPCTPAAAVASTTIGAPTGATLLDARDDELWERLAGHRFASLFTSQPWIELLARTYGFEVGASSCGAPNRAAAVLFGRLRDLRGDRVVCLPFSDYCDPLVEDFPTWSKIIEPLFGFAAPIRLRCLHNSIPSQDGRFRAASHAKWHAVDLTRSEEELWAGLPAPVRQNVRHARRQGVVVREGKDLADVRIFHALHVRLRKSKYRMLAQPLALFENLVHIFSPSNRLIILVAELNGVPIAGTLLIEWEGKLYYKFNASAQQHLRPNELMIWHAMQVGCRRQLASLDFGISDVDQPGLVAFKRKFASEEKDVRFLEWLPPNHGDPRGEQASQVLGCVTRLLTEPSVPDEVASAAGNELYRFFA
jgi:CelD/BcsL family acetyltransferase involved in cellulose biosynthesis